MGILILFSLLGYLSLSTTGQVRDMVFRERLHRAETAANSIDALFYQTIHQIESVARLEVLSDGGSLQQSRPAVLDNLVHIMGTYDILWLVDRDGALLWTTTPGEEALLTQIVRQPLLSRAFSEEATVLDQVVITDYQHPPVAVAVTPVWDREGRVYAVLVGSLHLSHMNINRAALPRGGPTFISTVVNRQGIVLATSEGIDIAFAYPEPHLELLRGFIEQRRGGVTVHEEPGGGGHLVYYAPLSALEGGVIMEERQDIALGIVRDLGNTYIILALAALLLALAGAWLLVQNITHPLRALGGAARRIAAGELDQPIPTSRGDEIGQLARSFESMRQELRARQEEQGRWERELESRVRERTEEVHLLLGRIISAQEEERKRLARELHDETAQTLATLLLALPSLKGALPPEQARQREMVDRFVAQGEEALRDIRRTILDLRPSNLDDMGLVAALRSFAEDRLGTADTQVHFDTQGEERRLPGAEETALFRIMQEAITNIVKHARAANAHILLQFSPQMFVGQVEDDGVGFDPDARQGTDGTGLGLQGMKERADLIGAQIEVTSTPGRGSRVRVKMPVTEESFA